MNGANGFVVLGAPSHGVLGTIQHHERCCHGPHRRDTGLSSSARFARMQIFRRRRYRRRGRAVHRSRPRVALCKRSLRSVNKVVRPSLLVGPVNLSIRDCRFVFARRLNCQR